MKRGQEAEGIVRRVDFPNKGQVELAESEESVGQGAKPGRMVTVKHVLPGQRIRLRLKKAGRSKSQGILLEVLKKAPNELEQAACPHFAECGGCSYQNLPYEDQRKLKEDQIRHLMQPLFGEGVDRIFEGVTASPAHQEYRNKMEFSFGDQTKGGQLALGMHKRGSFYDIVTVDRCRIISRDMRDLLRLTLDFFTERRLGFYHKIRHEGYLRHLLVRRAQRTGMLMVDLVTSTDRVDREGRPFTEEEEKKLLGDWKQLLLSHNWSDELAGILHTQNDSPADVIEDQGTELLYGRDFLTEEILGLRFDITPFSFFQTNSPGAEVLYETVREFIGGDEKGRENIDLSTVLSLPERVDEEQEQSHSDGKEKKRDHFEGQKKNRNNLDCIKGKTVFDLYSGTGTIAQILAPAAGHVIGVEIVEEAVAAARANAKKNGLDNCEFIAGDVLKVIDDIEDKPDFIVLDPPRDGIHPKALDKIIDYGVESMIYISCKPTSLVRDLEILMARGYEVRRMRGVDMFPATGHVEMVCLLSKLSEAKNHIRLKVDMDEMDVTAAENKGIYREIQEWVQEKKGQAATVSGGESGGD